MTEEDWQACADPTPMLAQLRADKMHRTRRGRRKLRLFAVGCGLRVSRFMSERGQRWLALGQRLAADELPGDELREVRSQTDWQYEEPDATTDLHSWRRAWCADHAAWFTLEANVMNAALGSADNSAGVMGIDAMPRGTSAAEYHAEREAQAGLVREIFGSLFRPAIIHRSWLTPTVITLATAAYEEPALPAGELDPQRLAILADAVEEAGCDNSDFLSHLRSAGPHVRGCWALDSLLEKG
jgi:hypothetical protein